MVDLDSDSAAFALRMRCDGESPATGLALTKYTRGGIYRAKDLSLSRY